MNDREEKVNKIAIKALELIAKDCDCDAPYDDNEPHPQDAHKLQVIAQEALKEIGGKNER